MSHASGPLTGSSTQPCDLRSANTVTGISIQDTIVNDPAQGNEPELWASDTETLVSEAAADLSGNELGSRAVARKPSTHSEYALRFRVDTYRPAHGGVYAAGRDGPAPATTQGTLKVCLMNASNNRALSYHPGRAMSSELCRTRRLMAVDV